MSKDEFWVAMYQNAKSNRTQMRDQTMAARLISLGDACLQRGDIQQLRQVVAQLMGLLPASVQDEVRNGHGSDVIEITH